MLWRRIKLIWQMIFLCRFSALVVVVFGLMFLFIDQAQDLLMALDDALERWRQWLFLYLAIWAAAISSWYWARILLSFDFPDAPPLDSLLVRVNRQLPRVLGVLMFAFVAAAILRAAFGLRSEPASFRTLIVGASILVAQGVLFFMFVLYRRVWLKRLDRRLARPDGEGAVRRLVRAAIRIYDAPETQRFRNFRELGRNTIVALGLSLLISAALFLTVLRYPIGPAVCFGAGAVVLTAAANLIPVGSLLVYWSSRCQLPFFSAVIAWAVFASFFNDNHAVRPLAGDAAGAAAPETRLALEEAFERWRDRTGAATARPFRPVIVATAGGGSRAAYWTAFVLGTIQDQCPAFGDRLFAISGVSGGSLGATIFVGLLADQDTGSMQTCIAAPDGGRHFAELGRDVAANDFLAPTLAGLLYPDLAQRFLLPRFLPDRAEYLELSWESAWRSLAASSHAAPASQDLFAAPFAALWPGEGNDWHGKTRVWPALFLNGTNVETGKRVIASNLRIRPTFSDSYDAFGVVGSDLAVSTAVNFSTRFPYVEPAGTLRRSGENSVWGHVVDGGYLENFGAATAAEIVAAITAVGGADVKPIVIQISSDPEFAGLSSKDEASEPVASSFGRELIAPIRTFFNTRTARGSLAAEALRRQVERVTGSPDNFFHFRLCKIDGHYMPALGWALSHADRREIDGMLGPADNSHECNNRAELEKLMVLLRQQ